MCGIAGFISSSAAEAQQVLKRMTDRIAHRGPDDEGQWFDPAAGVGLGHRRLSILDLSPSGHQPMISHSGRYVIAFNGEVYNHHLVRAELEGIAPRSWRGRSDTEVIVEAFACWGVQAAAQRLVGMFAIALWDRQERVLHLVRDRVGEKPLYYGICGGALIFASELKALSAHPSFLGRIDRGALMLLMRHCYIPAPYTIYQGISKLLPGSCISISLKELERGELPVPVSYWSARSAVSSGLGEPFQGSDRQAVDALETLLLDAIGQQMVADVPLGAFLSGGIDSSTVVSLMQAQSARPIKTFTIGFHEQRYNEAAVAKEVSAHLRTEHTELYVSPRDALNVIPRLSQLYDEPFADSSQIPTFLVSQMTREHVTVSLSGDAGDELFGGYNRYAWGANIWKGIGWMPRSLRAGVAGSISAVSPQGWDSFFTLFAPLLPTALKQRLPGDKMHKVAAILGMNTPMEMYRRLVSTWKDPAQVVAGVAEPPTSLSDPEQWLEEGDMVQRMMYLDLISYLPDDILVKVDRAAMGVSLETRVPFLDHRVIEFAWKLPQILKIRGGQGKWLLRQVLYKYVPRELMERPKMGFGVPIDEWLRGPLREWAEELLDERRLRESGYFQPQPIRELWQEHLWGKRNWQYQLWSVLTFQAWLENR